MKSSMLQDESLLQPGTILQKTLENNILQASLESSKFPEVNTETSKAKTGTNETKKRQSVIGLAMKKT